MVNLNQFEYFIFDKDGTLVDSIQKYVQIFVNVIKNSYKEADILSIKQFYLESSGRPLVWQFKKCLELFTDEKDLSDEKILKLEEEFWKSDKEEDMLFYDGIKDLIVKLHNIGKKLFLTTGGQDKSTIKQLESLDILKYFEVVLGSDEIAKSKKHIEIFAKHQNLSLEEFSKKACYFGDTFLDINIAKECGIFMVSIATTFSKEILINENPDLIFNCVSEINNYL